jgi:hypothetical protein
VSKHCPAHAGPGRSGREGPAGRILAGWGRVVSGSHRPSDNRERVMTCSFALGFPSSASMLCTLVVMLLLMFLPFGLLAAYMAKTKGMSPLRGFWWGLLTGPIGILVVTFRSPILKSDDRDVDTFGFPKANKAAVIHLKCRCGAGFKVDAMQAGRKVQCPRCGRMSTVRSRLREPEGPGSGGRSLVGDGQRP